MVQDRDVPFTNDERDVLSNFGYTTLIAVGFSLCEAIFVMPAILSMMGKIEDRFHHEAETRSPVPES